MRVFLVVWSAVVLIFAALVIINLPYPYLSPRWFCTSVGVMFVAFGFVGFINPVKRNRRND